MVFKSTLKMETRDFPGGAVVKTVLPLQRAWGTKIPHASRCGPPRKRKLKGLVGSTCP